MRVRLNRNRDWLDKSGHGMFCIACFLINPDVFNIEFYLIMHFDAKFIKTKLFFSLLVKFK